MTKNDVQRLMGMGPSISPYTILAPTSNTSSSAQKRTRDEPQTESQIEDVMQRCLSEQAFENYMRQKRLCAAPSVSSVPFPPTRPVAVEKEEKRSVMPVLKYPESLQTSSVPTRSAPPSPSALQLIFEQQNLSEWLKIHHVRFHQLFSASTKSAKSTLLSVPILDTMTSEQWIRCTPFITCPNQVIEIQKKGHVHMCPHKTMHSVFDTDSPTSTFVVLPIFNADERTWTVLVRIGDQICFWCPNHLASDPPVWIRQALNDLNGVSLVRTANGRPRHFRAERHLWTSTMEKWSDALLSGVENTKIHQWYQWANIACVLFSQFYVDAPKGTSWITDVNKSPKKILMLEEKKWPLIHLGHSAVQSFSKEEMIAVNHTTIRNVMHAMNSSLKDVGIVAKGSYESFTDER